MSAILIALVYQLMWVFTAWFLIPLELNYSLHTLIFQHVVLIGGATALIVWRGVNCWVYVCLLAIGLLLEYGTWFFQFESLYAGIPDELLDWLPIAVARIVWGLAVFGVAHVLIKFFKKKAGNTK